MQPEALAVRVVRVAREVLGEPEVRVLGEHPALLAHRADGLRLPQVEEARPVPAHADPPGRLGQRGGGAGEGQSLKQGAPDQVVRIGKGLVLAQEPSLNVIDPPVRRATSALVADLGAKEVLVVWV